MCVVLYQFLSSTTIMDFCIFKLFLMLVSFSILYRYGIVKALLHVVAITYVATKQYNGL
jgi:hypothetical protein